MLNGAAHQYFWPSAGNLAALSMVTEPLKPYQRQLTFVKGVDIAGSFNHMAVRAIYTGAPIADYLSADPAVKSLDQVVADHFASAAPTRYRSLHLGVIPADSIDLYQRYGRSTFFFAPKPVDYEANPVAAFDRTFKGSTGPAPAPQPGPTPTPGPSASFDNDVLDITDAEIGDLTTRVGASATERAKLDQHRMALKGLRPPPPTTMPPPSMPPPGSMPPPATGACDASPLASVEKLRPALAGKPAAAYQHQHFSDIFDAQIDIASRALVCGLTRVATIQAGSADGNVTVPVRGGLPHHNTSHGDQRAFAECQTWYAGKMLRLLKALDVPDPLDPGKTVLFNSLIVWMAECLPQGHESTSVPIVLMGNAGGAAKAGAFVEASGATNKTLMQTVLAMFGVAASAAPHFGSQTIAGLRA
jgi:hypothetical protein